MALLLKQKKDFTLKVKDPKEHGENVVFIKGGSVVLEEKWVFFPDLRIDLQQTILKYVSETSRRLFNNFNDILYVLVVLDKTVQVVVIPSISYNKNSFGDIKVFPDLSGKLPLILVRLTQDGSSDLKAFKPIQSADIEVYEGYGNFTIRGDKGDDGYKGLTGIHGETGPRGLIGSTGLTGAQGETGISGNTVQGVTGISGPSGVALTTFIVNRGSESQFYVGVLYNEEQIWNVFLEGDLQEYQNIL